MSAGRAPGPRPCRRASGPGTPRGDQGERRRPRSLGDRPLACGSWCCFLKRPSMRNRRRTLATAVPPLTKMASYNLTTSSASTWPSAGMIPIQGAVHSGRPARTPLPYPSFVSTRRGRMPECFPARSQIKAPVLSRDPLSTATSSSLWPALRKAARSRVIV